VSLAVLGGVVWFRSAPRANPGSIRLPSGFSLDVYASGLDGPRSLALGERGTLFIGTRDAGNVYALRDTDDDFSADEVHTIARGLSMPNGVAVRDGALYVAEVHRVLRYDDIEQRLETPPQPVVVRDDLPTEGWHGWRYLGFGPDDMLYMSIGAPCNVCTQTDERFATIVRMRPDGTDLEVFARGVRNSVGFDWHPETGELWFTDNGRDFLGNDQPPDELNHAPTQGLHFGFPYCHGGTISDPEYGDQRACHEFVSPVQALDPHVASLGVRFYTGTMFPPEYRGQLLIAEHGSWNRFPPSGYRIRRVRLEGSRAVEYEPFAEGWLRLGRAWGRPADLLMLPDGSVVVSDDRAGKIYRISYRQ
jgi:glucose/arabinose dehydrogenase